MKKLFLSVAIILISVISSNLQAQICIIDETDDMEITSKEEDVTAKDYLNHLDTKRHQWYQCARCGFLENPTNILTSCPEQYRCSKCGASIYIVDEDPLFEDKDPYMQNDYGLQEVNQDGVENGMLINDRK